MRHVVLAAGLFVGLLLTAPASAQTVEYELPETIDVAPGKLSVTFADSVAEASAVALVEALGHRVEAVNFYDVRVTATADTVLSESAVRALEANPRVRSVEQSANRVPGDAPDPLATDLPRYTVTVHIAPDATWYEARDLVAEVPGLRDLRVRKLPNDLVVAVDDEAAALDALEASPLVAYVTYVAE